MKSLLRNFMINFAALLVASMLIPGFQYTGGPQTLLLGAIGLMVLNVAIIPLLKVMFLPLNLLTLGLFAWVVNVVALYLMTTYMPVFKLVPYDFPGANLNGFMVPSYSLNLLEVAIIASFLIGFVSHFLQWLCSSK
jgi:putative membrane protein